MKDYTLLSLQYNTDYLEYIFMLKQIFPAVVNITSPKVGANI